MSEDRLNQELRREPDHEPEACEECGGLGYFPHELNTGERCEDCKGTGWKL